MYRILDERISFNVGVTQPPSIKRTKTQINVEISKVINHLRSQAYDTGNDHILVKALNITGTRVDDTIFEAYDRYTRSVHRIAKACGFTSTLWAGVMNDSSMLYGDDYDEAVIVKDSEIDLLNFESNWRDLKCMRVITHPISSVSVPSFLKKNVFEEKGIVVIELDLVLMCMQYRQWLKVQIDKQHETIMTMGQFLYQVVLPSAIESHMDIMVMNRLMVHFEGFSPSDFVKTIPSRQIDYSDRLDSYLMERITIITNKTLSFAGIAQHLELLSDRNLYDIAINPKVTYSRHNEWVLNIGVMRYLNFLLALEDESPGTPNRQEKTHMKRRIVAFNRSNGLKAYVSRTLAEKIEAFIDNGIMFYL